MSKHPDTGSLLDPLDPEELWLIQEESAELGETDLEAEEAFRELAAAILNGGSLQIIEGDLGGLEEVLM